MKKKTICILTSQVTEANVNCWDPDSIHSGIAGSEEAIIFMAKELAELGHQVLVLFVQGGPPDGSPHSHLEANPCYRRKDQGYSTTRFDIAIAWRMPISGLQLKDLLAPKVYLWPHDILHDKVPKQHIHAFDDVLWLSAWQRQQWISSNPGYAKFKNIYGNGIDPSQFGTIQPRTNPFSCIYGSNYGRGLETLLDLWPLIKQRQPKATLDIYYGWENSGWLTHQSNREPKMRRQIATLPDVREHGRVGHEELNRAYAASSFWTYPCDTPETFCITALRAQFAGAVPVVNDVFALPETVRHGYRCQNPEDYFTTLMRAFDSAETITLDDRKAMGKFILQEYTWKAVAKRWVEEFNSGKA